MTDTAIVTAGVIRYRRLLLAIAGMGGVLYGYDIGIIGSALLYLDKSIELSAQQTSWIVAALLGGGIFSCILAGLAADLVGRRRIILTSAWLFMASIPIICMAMAFSSLATGRLIQGFSTGMIAVVIPLYLAECLPPEVRGSGMAIFQLMLNVGIMLAQQVGALFTALVERHATAGDPQLAVVQDHAWRWMFATASVPGALFLIGGYIITESPRWLVRRGQTDRARQALLRSRPADEAERELAEMGHVGQRAPTSVASLLQRRYLLPFLITLAVLGLNQATGINSMIQYVVVILHQAGMTKSQAATTSGATGFGLVVFTLLAVPLVDRLGRKRLLQIGTAGIIVAMGCCAALFAWNESHTTDVTATVRSAVTETGLSLPMVAQDGVPMRLAVLLDSGSGERLVSVTSADSPPVLTVEIPTHTGHLTILRATQGAVPSPLLGWAVLAAVLLFIASYAFGPGVCVWLVLSELMPTRIRSLGMGIALVFNTTVSTYIAAVFLPTVCAYGYAVMFMAWGSATVLYFLVAAFVLPETKGRSLEEIEELFAGTQT
jgi:MFS family permease